MFAAAYDFRYGIQNEKIFEENFAQLIELAYHQNNETPVTLVSHSFGCQKVLYFLQNQPDEWK